MTNADVPETKVGDMISRQVAIDALCTPRGILYPISTIEELPSAERKGKWIYLDGLDAFECSVCGRQMVRNIFDYCPWCGSRMERREE